MLGEWAIYAEVQGHTYNKTFEVKKYGKFLWLHKPGSTLSVYVEISPIIE